MRSRSAGKAKYPKCRDGEVRTYYVTPEDFGIPRAPISAIQGGDARPECRNHPRDSFRPGRRHRRDVVLLNAAAGLVVGGKAAGLREGIQLARESIQSGKAMACLEKPVDLTHKLAS